MTLITLLRIWTVRTKGRLVEFNNVNQLREELDRQVEIAEAGDYIPSGLQEERVIAPFGSGKYRILYMSFANKTGKSATGANIIKNIAFDADPEWFNYQIFNLWPYPKSGRIIGTTKNTADDGPIRAELKRWLPVGKWHSEKAGKLYESQYNTNTGFDWDVMTYEQDPDQLEGPVKGWTWADEPPPASFMGGIMSRFYQGGILWVSATPVGKNVGAFLDILDDLKDKGTKVYEGYGSIYENCTENGIPNHKGTKRGLMTPKQIHEYVSTVPTDEVDARIKGIPSKRSGKIYPQFKSNIHVKNFDLDGKWVKECESYCSFDPHRKYYPFLSWWLRTPANTLICYNEWPRYSTFNQYYDEVRNTAENTRYGPKELSKLIKIMDGTDIWGIQNTGRFIDPFFEPGTRSEWSKDTEGMVSEFSKYSVDFTLPSRKAMEMGRDLLRDRMKYDEQRPINEYNHPTIYVMPHCMNMRRSFERHHWVGDLGAEKEGERYKDPVDTARMVVAGINNVAWQPPRHKSSNMNRLDEKVKDIEYPDLPGTLLG